MPIVKKNLGTDSFAFLGALALHAATTVAWYTTLRYAPLASTLAPWGGLFVCGLVLGLLVAQSTIGRAAGLGILMSLMTSCIHMGFAAAGKVEDARTPGDALFLGVLSMPISIALSCAGASLGAWLRTRLNPRSD